ncbi:MAG: HAD-IA family hydrolase [Flavobacteriaceae bacterium]|nr:HAD-IA family hydrolase [Bacteroidia bacterium]NNK83085.1 HAD-IA family hydrolase [Flavobacteriaceae bacterium]
MKTILVDAWNTFVTKDGINHKMQFVLDGYSNPKIILTNANDDEKKTFGIVNMPYPVFSLAHKPNKPNPDYFKKILSEYDLNPKDVIYFEHNEDAVKSAESLGIKTLWLKKGSDLTLLEKFLESNI